jgi:hypothetical protein
MDPMIMHFVLAGVTGFGAGALFSMEPKESSTGKPPKPCPKCPPLLGAVIALVLWALLGAASDRGDPIVASVLTGLGAGLFGGGLSALIGLSHSR